MATAQSRSSADFRNEMKRISIPVRIIHGTAHVTVPIDASGRNPPMSCLSEYEGEPHGLFLTAADRLNQELIDFVRGFSNINFNEEKMASTFFL